MSCLSNYLLFSALTFDKKRFHCLFYREDNVAGVFIRKKKKKKCMPGLSSDSFVFSFFFFFFFSLFL